MLVTCPECEKKISENAHSCPHCGLPDAGGLSKEFVERYLYDKYTEFCKPTDRHYVHPKDPNYCHGTVTFISSSVELMDNGPGYGVAIRRRCSVCGTLSVLYWSGSSLKR
jgi:hypothetical protein